MQSIRARWPVMAGSASTRLVAMPPQQQQQQKQRRCRAAASTRDANAATTTTTTRPGLFMAPKRQRLSRVSSWRTASTSDDSAATTTTAAPAALSTADFDESAAPPPGCSRYNVSLMKPMGLVLEQDTNTMVIRVAKLTPEGAAEKAGVSVGDQLLAVSGIVYGKSEEYGEVVVKKQQQRVRMSARGETLKTISAAIMSHPGSWSIDMSYQRCDVSGGGGN